MCIVILILLLISVYWIHLMGCGAMAGFCEHSSEPLILHEIWRLFEELLAL